MVEETRIPGKTTDLSQVTEKLYHICCIENTSPREVYELTTLVALIVYVDDTLAIYSSTIFTIDMVQYDIYSTLILLQIHDEVRLVNFNSVGQLYGSRGCSV